MTDIATLELDIRATDVERGDRALAGLARSASRAEQEAERMGRTFRRTEDATQRLTRQAGQATLAMRSVSLSGRGMQAALQNASFQVQDIATQLALGVSPLQTFAIQGSQLASAFGPVLGPAGLLVTGAATAALAISALVDETDRLAAVQQRANDRLDRGVKLQKELADVSDQRRRALEAEQRFVLSQAEAELAALDEQIRRTRDLTAKADEATRGVVVGAGGIVTTGPERALDLSDNVRELEKQRAAAEANVLALRALAGAFDDGRSRLFEFDERLRFSVKTFEGLGDRLADMQERVAAAARGPAALQRVLDLQEARAELRAFGKANDMAGASLEYLEQVAGVTAEQLAGQIATIRRLREEIEKVTKATDTPLNLSPGQQRTADLNALRLQAERESLGAFETFETARATARDLLVTLRAQTEAQRLLLDLGGAETEEYRVQARLLQVKAQLGDDAATMVEREVRAQERVNAELRRLGILRGDLASLGERTLGSLVQLAAEGRLAWEDLGATARGILQEISSEILKLGAINPLKNALFGSELPTLGDLGGLFGGDSVNAGVEAQATASMAALSTTTTTASGSLASLTAAAQVAALALQSMAASGGAGGGSGIFGSLFGALSGKFDPGVGPGGKGFLTFGGPRADGGPVAPGFGFLVGERGPEIFMPDRRGAIIPNGQAAGVFNSGADPQTARDMLGELRELRHLLDRRTRPQTGGSSKPPQPASSGQQGDALAQLARASRRNQ